MINVIEAKQILSDNFKKGAKAKISLAEALDFHLAEDIYAPINVPSFNQSAMDGYAFRFEDLSNELSIIEEIPAGDTRTIQLQKGEAVRIFTGAKIPDSCDTVVMQELTEVDGNRLKVKDAGLKLDSNIRKEGHQIKSGDLALKAGQQITPATIGFLSSLGIPTVEVYQKPSVTILATGDELIKPGNPLQKGQVYESNSIMLQAAFENVGIEAKSVYLPDNLKQTILAIRKALNDSDMLILSGGISVGDYDFVKPALEANAVEQLFYKVKQKPGKPLYFGKKESALIFALPGNPAAALNCFYLYVLPVINNYLGKEYPFLKTASLPINQTYQKKSGRAEFLKAYSNGTNIELLEGQGSDVLLSFAKANCLVYLDEQENEIEKGQLVNIYLIP